MRLTRGLYQLPDAALDAQQSLAETARLMPKVVICPASALAFHGLTDQMPPKVWLAIGRKDLRPLLTYPPILRHCLTHFLCAASPTTISAIRASTAGRRCRTSAAARACSCASRGSAPVRS